jgi:hypothetical protein
MRGGGEFSHESDLISSYLMQRTISNMIASLPLYESLGTFAIRLPLWGTSNKGAMFSFFNSYYVDGTAIILLSRGRIAASELIASHFRRFGLTIHWSQRERDD